jgi:hypothetical protein
MRTRYYSPFWLGALAPGWLSSPEWAWRDAAEARVHPAETIEMGAWLRLSEHERVVVVEAYALRRPKASKLLV